MQKKVIVFGDNAYADMLYNDIKKYPGEIEIEAFCVDEQYLKGRDVLYNKPMISFQEAIKKYPPEKYDMISVIDAPTRFRNRMIVFNRLKQAGYYLRNYISPMAYVCEDLIMGENNIIMPFSYVGPSGRMGNANMIRQFVYTGHDFVFGDGNIIASGSSIAGFCKIGNSCFLGVNVSVVNCVHIADETLVGAGSVVLRNTESYTTIVGNPAKIISTHEDTGIIIKLNRGDQNRGDQNG